MPTVLRTAAFLFGSGRGTTDRRHVHVFHGGDEVVILLGDDVELPSIRDIRGMPLRRMRAALELVALNQELLLDEWKKIYE